MVIPTVNFLSYNSTGLDSIKQTSLVRNLYDSFSDKVGHQWTLSEKNKKNAFVFSNFNIFMVQHQVKILN